MKIFKEFERCGKLLFQQHLISLTAGNLSIRKDDTVYITASGSMLGALKFSDIIEVSLDGVRRTKIGNFSDKIPSIEIDVHKSIYSSTGYAAIAHAHPIFALSISFEKDKIAPLDSEGKFHLPEIPVVTVKDEAIASVEVAARLPALLKNTPVVIVRGHGVFAVADSLLKACSLISTLEFSAEILYRQIKKNLL